MLGFCGICRGALVAGSDRSIPVPIKHLSDYPARRQGQTAPLISVVTCVRNGEAGIARTIDSVAAQSVSGLEYIIVDGGSTDGTLGIVRNCSAAIDFWQSEPDAGISDGLNKGIALSRGRYVALIHADDWLSPDQLLHSIETLEASGADFVFGNLMLHNTRGPSHGLKGDSDYVKRISHIMPALNHPTVVVRRSAYQTHGLFNTDYRLAMDYELLLRFHRAGLKGVYDPRITGHMSLDGVSEQRGIAALMEVRRASIQHGYSRLLADLRFAYRVAKMTLRRSIQFAAPEKFTHFLRALVNPSFRQLK